MRILPLRASGALGAAATLFLIVLVPGAARAEPPEAATYTPAELAALDRALEAANLDREGLTFRKDLAEGHAALPLVHAMLRDPMRIAPEIDGFVRDARAADQALHPPLGALMAAHDRVGAGTPLAGPGQAPAYAQMQTALGAARRKPTVPLETPEQLAAHLVALVLRGERPPTALRKVGADRPERVVYQALRRDLPAQMAWHEVFDSPYTGHAEAKAKAYAEAQDEAWLHEAGAAIPVQAEILRWIDVFGDPVAWLGRLDASAFPSDTPSIAETPFGRVALGTHGDDTYTGDFTVLIDPGGNDRYQGCRLGAAYGTKYRRVGFFADLGGDDVYECAEVDITLGAAVLGVAAFLDLGAGDDRYAAGHCSLGAAMGGVAVFYDDGGSDTYEGRTFTQGAAGFGVGIFQDDAVQARPVTSADEGTKDPVDAGLFDNDRLRAWSNAQAFARCRGVAMCLNTRGNDVYEAGGVYLHAPLFADRYQSFSQGFAIGERGSDYAGGIALIADYEGNDRYLGDVYNQGVGYWYSAGLLYDGGGNDLYEMTQYGQGSGIHLAVGGLVDEGGHDTYVMHSGLGQGGSHDYAASILHDRGGNDHYMGMTSCNGCGLTNSVGLHIDRAGNDTYAGRKGSLNSGRPARGFASIGVLVDLQGVDHYLGIMEDGTAWRHTDIGVGLDIEPVAEPGAAEAATPSGNEPTVEIPAVCSYEGELTPAIFDELWAIAVRWEVGENRHIVPKARDRIIAFGAPVLPHLDRVMDKGASGLELRAYQQILTGLGKAGAAEGVTAFLVRNLEHASPRRRKVALWLAGEMKAKQVEAPVVTILRGEDASFARRAAGVLRRLESHAGDEVLLGWLQHPEDELRVGAALDTLLGLKTDCYPKVRGLLAHPMASVRTRLATLLATHDDVYGKAVEDDFGPMANPVDARGKRTLLDALARRERAPSMEARVHIHQLLEHESWGLRADAARVLQGALDDASLDEQWKDEIRAAFVQRLGVETEPYVRFWLGARLMLRVR